MGFVEVPSMKKKKTEGDICVHVFQSDFLFETHFYRN